MTDEQKFIIARWAYSVGKPIISDAEYTTLLRYFESTRPDWEYVTRSWSSDPCPVELLKATGHTDLIEVITLTDKTESIPSLNNWKEVCDTFSNVSFDTPMTLSYKHDGWNVQATYYNGDLISVNTRGRSTDALDVSILKSIYPAKIPVQGRVKVIGECTVSKSLFKDMKVKFGNVLERSAVRTALANSEYALKLSVHAFDIIGYECDSVLPTLQQWGFSVPTWEYVRSYDELVLAIKKFDNAYGAYEFPTDGLVVALGANRKAIRVGNWEEPTYQSYVTGYEQSYGPYTISMKVLIKPIHTSKGMQYRIPITNLARIVNNHLEIGYPISFNTVSGAIADFNENATKLLHRQYEGNYAAYRKMIDDREEIYDYMDDT